MTDPRTARSCALLVALLVLVLPLPFLSELLNANNATRALLTQALVEQGTTRIDAHAALTVDKAEHGGHAYSDKAPGMALLAIPAYATGLALAGGAEALDFAPAPGEAAEAHTARMLTYRLMVLTTSGLLTALAAGAFCLLALRMTGARGASVLATLTVFLGTPILGWSVNFFGHAAAGAVLFLGFFLLSGLRPGSRTGLRCAGAGALLGLAMVIEYTTAPAAALIGGYGIWQMRQLPARQALGLTALALVCGLVALLPLFLYHTLSFGGPLATGYSNVVGFEGMKEGFMGLTWPRPWVLGELIFGPRRGILWLSPVLILVPVAFWSALRAGWMRAEVVTGLAVGSYFFALNAAYHYWDGGASMGPRHATPGLVFLCLPMIRLWAEARGQLRRAMIGLLVLSIAINLGAAATTMTPIGGNFPLRDHIAARILAGDTWFAWWAGQGTSALLGILAWAITLAVLGLLLWLQVRDEASSARKRERSGLPT